MTDVSLGVENGQTMSDNPRPYLQFVLEEVLLVWHLAIETQQTLLLWAERLKKITAVKFLFFSSLLSRSG